MNKNSNLLGKLINVLDSILKDELSKHKEFPKEFTFFHVIERTKCNLDSLQLLIDDDVSRHEHAIGLIKRNLLSDFITTGYILRLSDSKEDLISKLYSLYHSDLKKVKDYIERSKSTIPEAAYEKFASDFTNNDHIFGQIQEYYKAHELKSFPTTTTIFDYFFKIENKDIWIKLLIDSYDLWLLLSKYEHLGWYSYAATRNIKRELFDERLRRVLLNASIMIAGCLEILGKQEEMKAVLAIIREYYSNYDSL